ncbi:MAG: MauE/DoxX family redox-associated membrane protein [Saprospiraceae bacterium]
MDILYFVLLLIYAGFYIYAGYTHYSKAWFFKKITPPLLQPWKEPINVIVGVAEILGGIGLLIPQTRVMAAWGIIALLIAVFPANIYMATSKGAGVKINQTFLWLRLPLQFVLIGWAYYYTL